MGKQVKLGRRLSKRSFRVARVAENEHQESFGPFERGVHDGSAYKDHKNRGHNFHIPRVEYPPSREKALDSHGSRECLPQ